MHKLRQCWFQVIKHRVKILMLHFRTSPRTSISLRELWKVHFTQHASSIERPCARMSPRFFATIEHGQKSSKLGMSICLYVTKAALDLFPFLSVGYSRNKVCKNTCMLQSASFGAALLHNTGSVVFLLIFFSNANFNP